MDLDLSFRTDDAGRSVISMTGAVDLATREVVQTACANALDAAEEAVVLDLSGVSFIDSTGLGVLVRLANLAAEDGKQLILRNPSSRVLRLLELTTLDSVLDIEQPNDPVGTA